MSESSHNIIQRILEEQNIEIDQKSGVVQKLNEFMANYTLKLLKDAKLRSVHLKKDQINYQDIKQATGMKQSEIDIINKKNNEIFKRIDQKQPLFGGVILPNKKMTWNLSTNQYLGLDIYEKQKLKDKLQYKLYQNFKEEIKNNRELQDQIVMNKEIKMEQNFEDDEENFDIDDDEDENQQQESQNNNKQKQNNLFDNEDEFQKDNNNSQNKQIIGQQQNNDAQSNSNLKRKFKFNFSGLVEVEDETYKKTKY
ncbi:Histone-fold [Pseudocohnilembus persalinus]|uniref:Histone-fold n=1 Tax=Pseudocohnilembus persalinus TaxID=266149 RepID=A0A0V0Q7T3_PSEPJ|nr:Histone-fold [Pseudocohnilembus persalinus]|eukprot:KRW98219.1 Histone-fold [Pseudocohnilembus persalinus]